MGYRYISVRINSVNYDSMSCENFRKFGPVTSELTGLICERQVRHAMAEGPRDALVSRNSATTKHPI